MFPLFGQLGPLTTARRQAVVVPPFDPTTLPGMALWLKADVGTFADVAKTTPSTGGGDVKCWADQSGLANDAAKASGNPTLTAAALNGLPAVSFNTTVLNLTTPIALGAAFTLYVVCLHVADANVVFVGSVSNPPVAIELYTDDMFYIVDDSVTVTNVPCGVPMVTPFAAPVAAVIYRPLMATPASVTATSTPAASFSGANGTVTISMVGDRGAADAIGSLCELLLYTAAHDGTQRAGMAGYFSTRWGVTYP